ncbi:MAG: hypothetical protein NC548_50465 [Lachnospiraceae bacterium]|nr:hypothetical protein [Lachnospiraceae bacterium]
MLTLLLLASVESKSLALVKILCENFESELKEAFRFCEGLKMPYISKEKYAGKIIYPETTQDVNFMLDKMGYFLDKTAFFIKGENLEYLNAALASKTMFWYLKQICSTLGAKGFSASKIFVERLPIVETQKIDSKHLSEIETLAKEILEINNSCHSESALAGEESLSEELRDSKRDISALPQHDKIAQPKRGVKSLEARLDSLIYQVYELNNDEISLIESEFSNKERERTEIIESIYHLLESFTRDCIGQYQGKIVWAEMTNNPCFVYDDKGYYINQTCYFIPKDDKYLCAVLNSKLIYFYMRQMASSLGEGAFRWIKQFIERLPIPQITQSNQHTADSIIALVEEILKFKATCHSESALAGEESLSEELRDSKRDISGIRPQHDATANTSKLESEIDSLVYKLYDLSDEEIKIIESKN